ncbi:uncharacterized protein LOC124274715 isoform X3 [Haliotis rubra]|uniref:uncharacterized protein LOC124274715 isoform X3 n=1 Tax=Haliotis rubra TaxID=36100 RepID=UPI001EE57ADB|nr:uncharacterized protein LOC124274715 isoform X3 [Haliotis rubra]
MSVQSDMWAAVNVHVRISDVMLLLLLSLVYLPGVVTVNNDVLMDGDVVLGGLFSVQDYTEGRCESILPSSIMTHEAIRWFFKKLNERNYISNVSLGLHAYKTCGQPPLAVKATIAMKNTWDGISKFQGIVGPGFSAETQDVSRLLSSLPEEDRLLQISYSATAAILSDKSVYKNLYRVIETDDVQVEIMVQLMKSLQWNYIAIVYGDDTYGREGAKTLKSMAESHGICIPVFVPISPGSVSDELRQRFETIKDELQKDSQSPVVGLAFFGQAETAKAMFDYLEIELSNFQMIVSESIGESESYLMKSDGSVYPLAKGLLTPSPPYYDVELFQLHWQSLHTQGNVMREYIQDDDWLLKYMEQVTKCSLANETNIPPSCLQRSTDSVQNAKLSIYTNYALMAAAAFAKTYKTLYELKCPQQTGVCKDVEDYISNKAKFIEEMAAVEVNPVVEFTELSPFRLKFGFRNGELMYTEMGNYSTYIVNNYQQCDTKFCHVQAADYDGANLTVSTDRIRSYRRNGDEVIGPVAAQCQQPYTCDKCSRTITPTDVLYIPGDYYIVGLVPIHNKKQDDPLQCGELRTADSVDIAESISFAIKRANSQKTTYISAFGEKTVGLVLIDTCNNPFQAREQIIQLHRGELKLSSKLNSSMLVNRIIGYVGPYGSSVSVPVSTLLAEIDELVIAFAASSVVLSDRTLHPTFMRPVSPDNKQADVIMHLAKILGAKYVQILYTDEVYGITGKEALEKSAKIHKVCIAQSLKILDSTASSNSVGYVSELRKFRHARMVIVFVRSHVTPILMTALNKEVDNGEFVFIGGESWGKRPQVLTNNFKFRGSLTIGQDLPRNTAFEDHYREIDLEQTENPWLQEYLEERNECYYPLSFKKKNIHQCSPTVLEAYRPTDTWVPFAINAAHALIIGFNQILEDTCFGSFPNCPEYSTAKLIEKVKAVRLDMYYDGRNVRVFDDNGEGNVAYTIYQIIREGSALSYKRIGTSENGVQFVVSNLDTSFEVDLSSSCQNDVDCGICSRQFNKSGLSDPVNSDNVPAIILGGFVAVLVIVVIALVVVLVKTRRRAASTDALGSGQGDDYHELDLVAHSRSPAQLQGEHAVSNVYLTAIPGTPELRGRSVRRPAGEAGENSPGAVNESMVIDEAGTTT